MFSISSSSEISFEGVYSNSRDFFIAEPAENSLFHHLSLAFHKVLTGAHMGKGRPWAALSDHMGRFVPRAPIWVSQELTFLMTSLKAEKLLRYQTGVLEEGRRDCLIGTTLPSRRGREGRER